jgi:hypothetical protein
MHQTIEGMGQQHSPQHVTSSGHDKKIVFVSSCRKSKMLSGLTATFFWQAMHTRHVVDFLTPIMQRSTILDMADSIKSLSTVARGCS